VARRQRERDPRSPANQHIATDEAVVELSKAVVDETPATTYSVKVDIVQDSVQEDEAIQFADLPEVDRAVFADKGLADGDVVGIGTTFLHARGVISPPSFRSPNTPHRLGKRRRSRVGRRRRLRDVAEDLPLFG